MEYLSSFVKPLETITGCLVIGSYQDADFSAAAALINDVSDNAISALYESKDFKGGVGKTCLLRNVAGLSTSRLLLVGLGKRGELSRRQLQIAAAAAANRLSSLGAEDAQILLCEEELAGTTLEQRAADVVHAIESAMYRYDTTKSKPAAHRAICKIDVAVTNNTNAASAASAVASAASVANGVTVARHLGNLPGNICTPTYLAEQGLALANEFSKITTTVVEEEEMAELGMGALLAVSQGSIQPAKLITMEYNGGPEGQKPHVIVGKGLTFDAGGISLKPGANMDAMKMDKCGGTAVFGVMRAIAEMGLPLNVVGVVPSSENLPDAKAVKPGDVITAMDGTTIEVLNTDAEGRLILCDAICYAKRFDPETMIDLATLTGAVVVALGNHRTAVFSPDQALANSIVAAGDSSFDRFWQMPLGEEYAEQLKSTWADFANIGGPGGGSITAAEFLHHFAKGLRWAHLDVAGTAMSMGGANRKGASGRPVRALVQYLSDQLA
jgi:leucyl aminopeptidase